VSPEVTKRSVLAVLQKQRLEDLGREFGLAVSLTAVKEAQVTSLADSPLDLPTILGRLRRDELRSACRAHGLDASGRGARRAHGPARRTRPGHHAREPAAIWQSPRCADGIPRQGQIVQVRQRQYLVTDVQVPDLSEGPRGANPGQPGLP